MVAVLVGVALVVIAALAVVVRYEVRQPRPTSPEVLDRLERLEVPPADELPAAWLERLERPRLLVHCTDDSTVVGTLLTVASDGLVLVGAELLEAAPDGSSVGLGGEVFIPRARVALVQRERMES